MREGEESLFILKEHFIETLLINEIDTFEFLAINIYVKHINMALIIVYNPPKTKRIKFIKNLNCLIKKINYKQVLIIGDGCINLR